MWRNGLLVCAISLGTLFAFGCAPNAAVSQASVAEVTLTPDLSHPGRQIPADFIGLSFETGLTLPNAKGEYYFSPDNAALIATFKTLGIKSLRIGGNTSDTPTVPIPNSTDIDHVFGFARAVGIKVIYGLRLRNQTNPASDVKIASYIMSHYKDQLECMAVGNEPNIYAKKYPVYKALAAKFYAAILAAEPEAMFCGPETTESKPEWSHDFTTDFGHSGHIRFLSQHYYAGKSARKVKTPEIGRDEILSPAFVAGYLKFYNVFGPTAVENRVPFRIDETNSFFNGGAKDVSDTQASALWALDYMYWWAWHNTIGLNFHTGDNVAAADKLVPCRYAVYWTAPDGYNVHPIGYAIKAFSLGMGQLVPVKISDSANLNLTAYATLGEENDLNVTIINKEHGTAQRGANVAIDVAGYGPAEVMYLAAPNGNVAATSGVTLGGASIKDDASWDGQWAQLKPGEDGRVSVTVPAATAAVVRLQRQ